MSTGGTIATGGTANGGSSTSLGGLTETGGISNTTGTTTSGGTTGVTATSGFTATGGFTSTGGTSGKVGSTAIGGVTSTGGTPATGGTVATGGAAAGGIAATGGTIGTGGGTAYPPKVWMAYVSGSVPYLVDITKGTFPAVNLATLAGASCTTSSVYFSPNGQRLFLPCTPTAAFIVDVSGSAPANPIKVNGNTIVANPVGWSPDSRWIGYFDQGGQGQPYTSNVYVVDAAGSTAPIPLATNIPMDPLSGFGFWAGSAYFVWVATGYNPFSSHLNGSSWSTAVPGPSFGGGSIIGTADGRFAEAYTTSASADTVVDLTNASTGYSYAAPCYFSANLRYAICHTTAINNLYTVPQTGTTALATFDQSTSTFWSKTSNRAAISSTNSANARYVDATVTTATNTEIPSSIGYTSFVFAPNDAWLGLGSTSKIAVLPLTGTIGAPTVVSTALPSGGTLSASFAFAPNGKSMYYIGQQTTAGTNELYWVDLSGSTPAAPRKLNADLAGGTNVTSAGFTSDSAAAYYVAGGSLYLTQLATANATGQLVLGSYSSFAFQP